MARSHTKCSVPNCLGDAARRGGADIPLCYEHGKLFSGSKVRQKIQELELAWAAAGRPIAPKGALLVDVLFDSETPEPKVSDMFCSELLDDIINHGS